MTAQSIADLVAKANARGPTSGFTDVSPDANEAYPEDFDPSKAKILTPLKVGDLILQHRIVHAPLGRSRCANHTETPLAVEYFRQRTTPGALMVSQATATSLASMAWPWGLSIEGPKRLAAVAKVIDAVHEKGGYWFQQLTHVGRASSPGLVKASRARAGIYEAPSYGYRCVSSSAVAESGINTHSGEAFGVPHALEVAEIRELVAEFKETARSVASVGADGIEVLAGNGFLLDQFLQDNVNQRDDEYGGSVENRSRFVLEVVDAVAEVVGYQRVGVRVSPFSNFHEMDGSQPLEQFLYLIRELALRGVAYVTVGEARVSRNLSIEENLARLVAKGIAPEDISLGPFRRLLSETKPNNPTYTQTVLIGNGGYTAVSGVLTVEDGLADAVSYGRRFIANPDLVQRIRLNHPLSPYDRSTFYTHGARGYTDYPPYGASHIDHNAEKDATKNTTETNGQGNGVIEKDAEVTNPQISGHIEKGPEGNADVPPKTNGHSEIERDAETAIPSINGHAEGTPNLKRVAVIGAGVSGILTASAFERLGGFSVQILERRDVAGGVWVFDPVSSSEPIFPSPEPTTTNPPLEKPPGELPVSTPRSKRQRFVTSPLYETLEANIPTKVMCGDTASDTSPYTNAEKPFLTGAEVCKVVAAMATKYEHLIQYRTTVENVETLERGKGVKLTLRREESDGTDTWYAETFDHLVVATGHNTVPRVPEVPGLDVWKGGLRHASGWRTGKDLKNQRVLIVGNSESAIDIVLQSLPHVKGDICVSRKSDHPRYPTVFARPGVKEVTTISRFEETKIHLDDGTVLTDIDTVVFATGYFYTHPFLSHIRPQEKTGGFRVPGLYQHIFDIHNPDTIAFVGVANVTLTWLAWEKAAFLAALHWSGKLALPRREEMLEWEARRLQDKGSKRFHAMDLPYERVAYFDELNELASEYVEDPKADDELLQCFPFEWVVELIGTRGWKLEKYGLTEDVRGYGTI